MIDLTRPITELVGEVRGGKLKATQLVRASLDSIKHHSDYHSVLEINDQAMMRAEEIDAGDKSGRLAGVPFIAKDNFLTHHTHTTASSKILGPFKAPYQATAIKRLEAEGAIMVAKSNMDAFGHGSSTENSDFGPTKNPVDPSRVPGGSSGGSAAAVALGLSCFAIGTDTGGSLRQPASLSGVVGLKPTYGLVSRYGVVAMGSSFDVIGSLARTVSDASLVLDVMAGLDQNDSTMIERNKASYVPKGQSELKDVKVGIIKEYLVEGTEPAVKKAILESAAKLKAAGAEVEEMSIPSTDLALACYYILIPAEISSNLARYDGIRYGHSSDKAETLADTYLLSRDEGFGPEAKRRILIGTYVLSSGYYDAYYKQAQKVRTLLIREFNQAFEKYDFLIGPTAPTTAFKLGEKDQDPLSMYLGDVDTVPISLVGAPAISIPTPGADLPIGLQLMAAPRHDRELLEFAHATERLLK